MARRVRGPTLVAPPTPHLSGDRLTVGHILGALSLVFLDIILGLR